MTFTSDRPITVDGVRLDTLAWNVKAIQRQTAARRAADTQVPGLDGLIPSLNDPLEPAQMGLEMFVRGRGAGGQVVGDSRTTFRENLDELIHLFGTRHRLLEVRQQVDGMNVPDRAVNGSFQDGLTGWSSGNTPEVVTTPTLAGAHALRLTATAAGDSLVLQNGGYGAPASLYPAAPGEVLTVAFHARAATVARTARADYAWCDAAGNLLGSYVSGTAVATTTTGWARATTTTTPAPAGTRYLRVILLPAVADAGIAVGEQHVVDAVTVTPGTTAPTYVEPVWRRAWAKVTDTIAPEVSDAVGSVASFSVALTLPYGVWEDAVATDWAGAAGIGSGVGQAVTSLHGATEQIRDAIILLQGPINAPVVRDRYGDTLVTLNRNLAAGEFWRLNCGTWASRVATNLTLGSADTAGTDVAALTIPGGAPNVGTPLAFYPVRRDPTDGALFPERRVAIRVDGSGITAATQVSVRARRKYAL